MINSKNKIYSIYWPRRGWGKTTNFEDVTMWEGGCEVHGLLKLKLLELSLVNSGKL